MIIIKYSTQSNFEEWFEVQLLYSLTEPSLTIMDTAAYHKCKLKGTPKPHKLNKQQIIECLNRYNVQHDPTTTTRDNLKHQLKTYINNRVPMEIEHLATDAGNQVLFTQAYHLDLQPIEVVWAWIK